MVYTVSAWTLSSLTLVIFILSILWCCRPYNPGYMKSLPIYFLGNILAEIAHWILPNYYPSSEPAIYLIFTIFELFYFSYFLTRLIESGTARKWIWMLDLIFLICLIVLIVRTGIIFSAGMAVIMECIILIIPCLVYFKEVFSRLYVMELEREPSFWMVTGIVFYFFLLIPTIWFSGYYSHIGELGMARALYSINNYAQIISYIIIIKAMTCAKKKLC